MRGLAKFLNFLYLLAYIILILGLILMAIVTVIIFIGFDVSFIREAMQNGSISLSGIGIENYTPEKIAQFRMPIVISFIGTILTMILGLRSIHMVRRALRETGRGTPFSTISVKSLRQAGIMSLLSAAVSIVFAIISYVMFSMLLDGQVTLTATSSLTMIFNALLMFLLSSVAKYGSQYVPNDEVLPPPAGNPYDDETETY